MDAHVPDSYKMPFGKYEGYMIGKVPAWYLDRLRGKPEILKQFPMVKQYIEENLGRIDSELEGR